MCKLNVTFCKYCGLTPLQQRWRLIFLYVDDAWFICCWHSCSLEFGVHWIMNESRFNHMPPIWGKSQHFVWGKMKQPRWSNFWYASSDNSISYSHPCASLAQLVKASFSQGKNCRFCYFHHSFVVAHAHWSARWRLFDLHEPSFFLFQLFLSNSSD